jgi:hypothetical protein
MSKKRYLAAAAQLHDGRLMVTGGNNITIYLNSSEIYGEEKWESKVPALPVTFYAHCLVTVNSTTVIAIGGKQNERTSGKTYYFTFGEESWTEGPEMKFKKHGQSCGKIRRNKDSQEMSIIVAGGAYGNDYLSSVEILDSGSNEWRTGPELPSTSVFSKMVEDQKGGVVLIGGYYPSNPSPDALYQLPHGGQDAVWTKMEQKLKIGRQSHTAFLVPDSSVDCS